MEDKSCRVISIQDAIDAGAPADGNLASNLFSHGSLEVEWYAPVAEDRQTPHTRDEIYVIARGSGEFFDGKTSRSAVPGTCIFVPAGATHRFENFSDDFATWVFFYGPEGEETP